MIDKGLRNLVTELRRDAEYDEAFAIVQLVRSLGETLTLMRQRAGLTQTELAKALGLTPGRVWQLESGTVRHAPNLKTIAKWARACGEVVKFKASRNPRPREIEMANVGARAEASHQR
jgi:transcriptional regulator with XRE-family HTH domain